MLISVIDNEYPENTPRAVLNNRALVISGGGGFNI